MSMIFSKREEKRQQEQLAKDVQAFIPELQAILGKYKIGMKPALQFTVDGVLPTFSYFRDNGQPAPQPEQAV